MLGPSGGVANFRRSRGTEKAADAEIHAVQEKGVLSCSQQLGLINRKVAFGRFGMIYAQL